MNESTDFNHLAYLTVELSELALREIAVNRRKKDFPRECAVINTFISRGAGIETIAKALKNKFGMSQGKVGGAVGCFCRQCAEILWKGISKELPK